jgi:hypothetical protein
VGIRSPILANDVPKKQLDSMLKKIWGETSAEDCKKYVIFRDIDGSTDLF